MSQDPQWYVSQEGQQLGPYTGEQMVAFAQGGNITRESMVWAEGMAEWLPAAQIEGLFPAAAPVAYAPAAASNFMRPGHATAPARTAQAEGGFPHPPVKAASFGLFAGCFGIALLLFIVAAVLSPQAAKQAETNPTLTFILLGMVVVAWLCLVIVQILGMIVLHRAWKCLSFAGATVTPGAAVGFLFIPFFNLYWIFRAYHGFAREWNHLTAAYEDTRLAPKMPEGLFLAFCIGIFLFPLGLFLVFPVTAALCRAINFIAFRPVHQPGAIRFR